METGEQNGISGEPAQISLDQDRPVEEAKPDEGFTPTAQAADFDARTLDINKAPIKAPGTGAPEPNVSEPDIATLVAAAEQAKAEEQAAEKALAAVATQDDTEASGFDFDKMEKLSQLADDFDKKQIAAKNAQAAVDKALATTAEGQFAREAGKVQKTAENQDENLLYEADNRLDEYSEEDWEKVNPEHSATSEAETDNEALSEPEN